MNPTIIKFGYPETLLRDYTHWVVLARPGQATLGSMVMAHKGPQTSAGDISQEAWAELATICNEIEATLSHHFPMEKINYLMLMMVDPEVHQHVIPRYSKVVSFEGSDHADPGWPAMPQLGHACDLSEEGFTALVKLLREGWVQG